MVLSLFFSLLLFKDGDIVLMLADYKSFHYIHFLDTLEANKINIKELTLIDFPSIFLIKCLKSIFTFLTHWE